MKRLPLVLASLLLWFGSADGQGIPVTPAGTSSLTAGAVQGVTGGVPIATTGTFTASLGGFTPSASGARMTPISVTTSDSSGTLPNGAVTVVEQCRLQFNVLQRQRRSAAREPAISIYPQLAAGLLSLFRSASPPCTALRWADRPLLMVWAAQDCRLALAGPR